MCNLFYPGLNHKYHTVKTICSQSDERIYFPHTLAKSKTSAVFMTNLLKVRLLNYLCFVSCFL